MNYNVLMNIAALLRLATRKELTADKQQLEVLCSVTWPMNGSEAGGDLGLMRTSQLLL